MEYPIVVWKETKMAETEKKKTMKLFKLIVCVVLVLAGVAAYSSRHMVVAAKPLTEVAEENLMPAYDQEALQKEIAILRQRMEGMLPIEGEAIRAIRAKIETLESYKVQPELDSKYRRISMEFLKQRRQQELKYKESYAVPEFAVFSLQDPVSCITNIEYWHRDDFEDPWRWMKVSDMKSNDAYVGSQIGSRQLLTWIASAQEIERLKKETPSIRKLAEAEWKYNTEAGEQYRREYAEHLKKLSDMPPMPEDLGVSSYFMDVVSSLSRDGNDGFELSAKFTGIIPDEQKKLIREAQPDFDAIMIVTYAPKWDLHEVAPIGGDPLIIGRKGKCFWLIDIFDLHPMERAVLTEYAQEEK